MNLSNDGLLDHERETIRDFTLPNVPKTVFASYSSGNWRLKKRRSLTNLFGREKRKKEATKNPRSHAYTVYVCFSGFDGNVIILDNIPLKKIFKKKPEVRDILTFSFVEAEKKAGSATAKKMHDIRTIHPVVLMKNWIVVKENEGVVYIKPVVTQIHC